jgi:hypothetical protein
MAEVDADDILAWRRPIWWDPIGPWVTGGVGEQSLGSDQVQQLTITQIGLQKEAIALQHQALELQTRALDAIASSLGSSE